LGLHGLVQGLLYVNFFFFLLKEMGFEDVEFFWFRKGSVAIIIMNFRFPERGEISWLVEQLSV
jgi:hypothetical protein